MRIKVAVCDLVGKADDVRSLLSSGPGRAQPMFANPQDRIRGDPIDHFRHTPVDGGTALKRDLLLEPQENQCSGAG